MVYYHRTNYCQYLIHFLSMEDPGFLVAGGGGGQRATFCEESETVLRVIHTEQNCFLMFVMFSLFFCS